jgi:predicted enzyme related to lactoylglutathione lyase
MNKVVVVARVEVEDIDAALPLYEALAGTPGRRFRFGELSLAWVGSFLLLEGSAADLARVRRTATLLTDDLEECRRLVREAGGEVLEGPDPAPNGPRIIARHADGAVFEYIQPAPNGGRTS